MSTCHVSMHHVKTPQRHAFCHNFQFNTKPKHLLSTQNSGILGFGAKARSPNETQTTLLDHKASKCSPNGSLTPNRNSLPELAEDTKNFKTKNRSSCWFFRKKKKKKSPLQIVPPPSSPGLSVAWMHPDSPPTPTPARPCHGGRRRATSGDQGSFKRRVWKVGFTWFYLGLIWFLHIYIYIYVVLNGFFYSGLKCFFWSFHVFSNVFAVIRSNLMVL